MKTKKSKLEGYLVVIPLREAMGFAVGLIAREHKRAMLGYFFDKQFTTLPTDEDLQGIILTKNEVVLIKICTTLGIRTDKWKLINQLEIDKNYWNVPHFCSFHSLIERHVLVKYDEMLNEIDRCFVEEKECLGLPKDGLAGHGWIELVLTDIFKAKQRT
jgi:hypothetical protein